MARRPLEGSAYWRQEDPKGLLADYDPIKETTARARAERKGERFVPFEERVRPAPALPPVHDPLPAPAPAPSVATEGVPLDFLRRANADANLSPYGLKVLIAVLTSEGSGPISLSRFMDVTGLCKSAVIAAIRNAVDAGYLTRSQFCPRCEVALPFSEDQKTSLCPSCHKQVPPYARYTPVYETDCPVWQTDSPVGQSYSPVRQTDSPPVHETDRAVGQTDSPVHRTDSLPVGSTDSPVGQNYSSPVHQTDSPPVRETHSPVGQTDRAVRPTDSVQDRARAISSKMASRAVRQTDSPVRSTDSPPVGQADSPRARADSDSESNIRIDSESESAYMRNGTGNGNGNGGTSEAEQLARASCAAIETGMASLGMHIKAWAHARQLDARTGRKAHQNALEAIVRELTAQRKETGQPQGKAWTRRVCDYFAGQGAPLSTGRAGK